MTDRNKIAKLLAALSEAFPSFRPSGSTAETWMLILGDYSEAQLMMAVAKLGRTHRHGAPSTSHVVEAIEGRKVREPVYVTAGDGSRVRKFPDGPYLTQGWREVRVDIETGEPVGEPSEMLMLNEGSWNELGD